MRSIDKFLMSNFIVNLTESANSSTILKSLHEFCCGEIAQDMDNNTFLFNDIDDLKSNVMSTIPRDMKNVDYQTTTFDNGNTMFVAIFTIAKGDKQMKMLTVPMKVGNNVWYAGQAKGGINSDVKLYKGEDISELKDVCEDEDFEWDCESQDIVNKIPDDKPVKLTNLDSFNRVLGNLFPNQKIAPEDNTGFVTYINRTDEGKDEGLFYDYDSNQVVVDELGADNDFPLVCCDNKFVREFFMHPVQGFEIIESYGYVCNKYSTVREMEETMLEASLAREGKKLVRATNVASLDRTAKKGVDLDVGGRGAAQLPMDIINQIKGLDTRLRSLIASWRRAHDDSLKEKLYNDEFIPLYDDIFAVVLGAGVTYGAIAMSLLNPIVAVAIGFITFAIANKWGNRNRRRVLELLNNKIDLVNEEIEDAKSENDLTTKRNLMQIKQQLVRKRDKIQMGKSMGAR